MSINKDKYCVKCGRGEDEVSFKGNRSKCKKCNNEMARQRYHKNIEAERIKRREWAKNNKEKIYLSGKKYRDNNPDKRRDYERKRYKEKREHIQRKHKEWIYNLKDGEYDKLINEACGKCCICKKECNKLVIDHDHITNKVRAFICHKCNNGLGAFEDSVESLQSAIEYLIKYKELHNEQKV